MVQHSLLFFYVVMLEFQDADPDISAWANFWKFVPDNHIFVYVCSWLQSALKFCYEMMSH